MLKRKKDSEEQLTQPTGKKSKKLVIIAIVVVVALITTIVGVGAFIFDRNRRRIPTLYESMINSLEYLSENDYDSTTMLWYKTDNESVSKVKAYIDRLCDEYDFEVSEVKDNDYCLYYNGVKEVEAVVDETSGDEYHIRITIVEDNNDEVMVVYTFVDALFDELSMHGNDKDLTEKENSDKKDSNSDGKNNTSGKDEVLVSALDSSGTAAGQKQGKDSVKFQSMFDYFSPDFTFGETSQSSMCYFQKFYASEEDEDVIAAYVDLLCSNGMNFKLSDDRYDDFRGKHSSTSVSTIRVVSAWGLSYTGTADVEESCENTFLNDKEFAITIDYKIEYGKIDGSITWSVSLDSCDLGFRPGGKTVNTAPGGKSATTGLRRTADGKYETTDGRFSAGLNEAVLKMDGKSQKCDFEYETNGTGSDVLTLNGFDSDKLIRVFFPYSSVLKTGTVYDLQDLSQKYQKNDKTPPAFGGQPDFAVVYQKVGSTWLTPTFSNSPCKDMTVRIMYYDEKEQVAVYYIYTYFLQEVEVFCVVDLKKASDAESQNLSGGGSGSASDSSLDIDIFDNGKDDICRWCNGVGKVRCNTCGGKGYYIDRGSASDYAGTGGKSYSFTKDCVGLGCVGGYKDCPHCH